MNQIAQGDVLLIRRKTLPEGAKRLKTRVLAEGEATGHNHALVGEAEVYEVGPGVLWVVAEEAVLTHQEHGRVTVEPGVWEVRRQRELDPMTGVARRVSD